MKKHYVVLIATALTVASLTSGCGGVDKVDDTNTEAGTKIVRMTDTAVDVETDEVCIPNDETNLETVGPESQDFSVEKAAEAAKATQIKTRELTGGSFSVTVTPTEYSYVVYGRIADYDRLTASAYGVVAIQPLDKGGEPYEGYPWMTCYVAPEVMDQLEATDYDMLDETVAFEVTIRNSVDGGGFIDLPEIMESFKMITVDEIPAWGGA